jgi:hypothetical protein
MDDQANVTKARRQNLPTLLTSPEIDPRNFSRFALSPMTALLQAKYKGVHATPITAVPIKSSVGTSRGPAIFSPSTPLRTTILERFLADTYEADALIEISLQQPLTLAAAGISDSLPTPDTMAQWSDIMSSPPETNSDCFSPVLGTGPAEQDLDQEPQSTISYKSEGEPVSALSGKSMLSSKSLPVRLAPLGLNISPRLGMKSAEEQIQQQNHGPAQTEPNPEGPTVVPMPCSPTSTESTFIDEESATTQATTTIPAAITVPPSITVPVAKTTRFRRNSFPHHKSNDTTLPTPDQNGHPHPLRSSPFDTLALSNDQEEQMKIMSPPPAPISPNFEDQLPSVKIRIEPSLFSPPPAPTLRFFPASLPEPVPTIGPSPFDPPPAPTLPRFHEEFPSSPLHARPAPIDTAITFVPWRRTQEPDSTMNSPVLPDVRIRSIDPPPAPTQPRFSEEFPASPARSKPAPIQPISSRETIVLGRGKTSQMTPSAPLTEHFDIRTPLSLNDNELPSPSVTKTGVAKPSKVVRFDVVDSPPPNVHFEVIPSPYPWSPRTFSYAAFASIDSPLAADFSASPFPKSENCKPTMADVLLDGTTPRGRTEQRLEKVGRLTRSMSPKNSRAEESVALTILPNTVFQCHRDQSYSTRSPITNDKNIILGTYFSPNKAAIHK